MRADPGSARRDVTQHRIERRAVFPLVDRIDPYQHAVDRQELPADFVFHVLVVNRGFGIDADRRELFEDAVESDCSAELRRVARRDHRARELRLYRVSRRPYRLLITSPA